MHTNSDRSVAHVRSFGLGDGIVVAVDDTVQILRNTLCDFVQIVVIKSLGLEVGELGKRNAGKVANSHFVLICVLHDLCAEI